MRFSQLPDTAYAVQTNLATFCIITKPRHTEGCLRVEGGILVGTGDTGETGETGIVESSGE